MYGKKSLVFGLILSGLPVVAAAEQLVLGIIGDNTRIAYLDKTFLQPFTKSTGISVKIASISENDGGDEVELVKRASREKWDFLTLD
jgi:spermidine/putrescine-binding protein